MFKWTLEILKNSWNFFHAKWNKDIWQQKKDKPKRYVTVTGCHTFFCPKNEWVRMIFVLPTACCCYITEKYASVILSKLHMVPNCINGTRLAQKPWKINENYKVFLHDLFRELCQQRRGTFFTKRMTRNIWRKMIFQFISKDAGIIVKSGMIL